MKINLDNNTGTLVMPDGKTYTKDSRQTGLNNNVAVIGPSGCGKSTVMGVLNSLNCGGSVLISDPKGGLYRTISKTLEQIGYKVMKLDLTHPEHSMHYNPFNYIKNTNDIQKLVHAIVYGTAGTKETHNDPFWDQQAEIILCSFIGYLYETNEPDINIQKVMRFFNEIQVCDDLEKRKEMPIFRDFLKLSLNAGIIGKTSWAYSKFHNYFTLSEKTLSCILSTATGMLNNFDNEELQMLFSDGHFDFTSLGREKIAMFVIVSDTDRSKDVIANLFYAQALNELCDYADNQCENGRLPVSATFILDDFATNCRIENFENIISNIRARNISTIIMLQSLSQLKSGYGDGYKTIMNNCDTSIFMGANSTEDAEYFSKKVNKPVHDLLEMKLYSSWISRRTEKARYVENIVPDDYLRDFREKLSKELREKEIST